MLGRAGARIHRQRGRARHGHRRGEVDVDNERIAGGVRRAGRVRRVDRGNQDRRLEVYIRQSGGRAVPVGGQGQVQQGGGPNLDRGGGGIAVGRRAAKRDYVRVRRAAGQGGGGASVARIQRDEAVRLRPRGDDGLGVADCDGVGARELAPGDGGRDSVAYGQGKEGKIPAGPVGNVPRGGGACRGGIVHERYSVGGRVGQAAAQGEVQGAGGCGYVRAGGDGQAGRVAALHAPAGGAGAAGRPAHALVELDAYRAGRHGLDAGRDEYEIPQADAAGRYRARVGAIDPDEVVACRVELAPRGVAPDQDAAVVRARVRVHDVFVEAYLSADVHV